MRPPPDRGLRVAAALVALASSPVSAKAGDWEARFEARARVEAIDGQFRPEPVAERDAALTLRTSLFAEYDAGPIRIGGELLDSRAYFQRRRSSISTNEVNALEPLQAYVRADLGERAQAMAGRFTFDLGSRRLVARNAFRNTINVFTGVRAEFGDDAFGAAAFWTVAPTRLPDDPEGIRNDSVELDRERGAPVFFGAFARALTGAGRVETYLYRLRERDSADILTRDRRLWTAGGRLFRAPAAGRFDWELEGAYQWGRARATADAADALDRRVSAGFVHGAVGRTLPGAWRPRVQFAVDYGSGDGEGPTLGRFDTLFGARLFDFGPTGLLGAGQRANLVSVELRGEARPDARTNLHLAVRPLRLARATDAFAATGVRDPQGRAGRNAGTQIDLRARRTLVPDRLTATAGMVYLAKGRFLTDAANAPPARDTRYGFVELLLTL
ncbi:MAG TPA: alginate export family protein [Sphingomonas sp.]|jgi:hypothetical protein